jgi:hypothetical protein
MHFMRKSWTDSRLDDFATNVYKRLDGVEAELKAMQRTMVHAAIALTTAFIAGFAAMIGLIATQL